MISLQQVSLWSRILAVGLVLLGIFVSVGYGLIAFFLLFLGLAMAGGALLYWLDGE